MVETIVAIAGLSAILEMLLYSPRAFLRLQSGLPHRLYRLL